MRRYIPILLFSCLCNFLLAQNYIMDGTPISGCSGVFTDSGGSVGDYGPNENLTTTICAEEDSPDGTHIRITIFNPGFGSGDLLCFFDGEDANAPNIACSDEFEPGATFSIQASAANTGGCLTVTFVSDGSSQGSGWSGNIGCIPACQLIEAILVSTDPPADPVENGWIDVCPSEIIYFSGAGNYPENGVVYEHSDLNSSFEWNFGDGNLAVGPTVAHSYSEPGGYIVQLSITDELGCNNSNLISQRVRVSTRPNFQVAGDIPSEICSGDTIQLASRVNEINSDDEVSVIPIEGSFQAEGVRSDSLPLPDGVGVSYETSILFTDFSPGQVLTNVNDFLGVCLNMEHSYMGDLHVELICPDGEEIVLQNQTFGAGLQIGIPFDPDDDEAPGAIETPWGWIQPGEGYEYCWTPDGSITWNEYGGFGSLPAGDYASFENLDGLIGCPLNGEWTLRVTDEWGADNGFIFSWSINFSTDLYPNLETFTPELVEYGWADNPTIFYPGPTDLVNVDSIAAAPQNAGTASYTFRVTDNFGCTNDTIVLVNVLPATDPACYTCEENTPENLELTICNGEQLQLDANVIAPLSEAVTYEAFPLYEFGYSNHPPNNPYEAKLSIASVYPSIIADALTNICRVCIDLETDYLSDILVLLRSPDGKILELSTENGGASDFYTGTCFTPNATTPITAGSTPFTGDYIPEGDWNILNGSPTNGEWSLLVSDKLGSSAMGLLKNWSMCFESENELSYNWVPSTGLSCDDCPEPTATPDASTNYTLQTSDNFGCTTSSTFDIEVVDALPMPVLDFCDESASGLTMQWTPIPGANDYSISLDNGMTWETPSATLSHTITGLSVGETVELLVQANIDNATCPVETGNLQCTYTYGCNVDFELISAEEPTCFGVADGLINTITQGSTPPLVYSLDGSPFIPGSTIFEIGAGDHVAVVMDAVGCTDTLLFTFAEPDEIVIDLQIDSVSCNGELDGSVTANAVGGSNSFNYVWGTVPATFGQTASGLAPGNCYVVTVTDGNGCTNTAEACIFEPDPLEVSVTSQNNICAGVDDGSATATGAGGTLPYMYAWSANDTGTDMVAGLAPGIYDVTITDSNGCTDVENFEISAAMMLSLDMSSTEATCGGTDGDGTATAMPGGGQGPYSYLWDPSTGDQDTQIATDLFAGTYSVTVTDDNGCTVSDQVTVDNGASVELNITTNPTLCVGSTDGNATANVSSGAPPFSYQWDDNTNQTTAIALNLEAGFYSVTVTDNNGCTGVAGPEEVGSAAPMVLALSATAPNCTGSNDGTVTVDASGGGGNYSYAWNTAPLQTMATATGLAPGLYEVTVTDLNLCTMTDTISLPNADAIAILDIFPSHVDCYGEDSGAATLSVAGGALPYNYLWDDPTAQVEPVAMGLLAGTYNPTVTDANGCTATAPVIITEPDTLIVTATGQDALCYGEASGIASSTVTGGVEPYIYFWDNLETTPDVTDLLPGTYMIQVTDANGCISGAMVEISQPDTFVLTTVNQLMVGCFGENSGQAEVIATDGTPPYSYEWSNGQATPVADNLAGGTTYYVSVIDNNGCLTIDSIMVDQLTEIMPTLAIVEPSCNGYADGQVAVTSVAGGAGNGYNDDYTYAWNTTPQQTTDVIEMLLGDIVYEVTVTDEEGCTNVASIELTQPPQTDLIPAVTDASCFGLQDGSATINAVGNNPPFAYVWGANTNNQTTETADSLAAGTYLVTVTDANDCVVDTFVVVDQPGPITLDFDVVNNICHGNADGSAQAIVIGGTPQYQYNWANGDTTEVAGNLSAGYNLVTVTDANGCMYTDSAMVNEPGRLIANLSIDSITCFGDRDGSIFIDPLGGTPPFQYSVDGEEYNGSSTKIGLEAASYITYIIDANGCVVETPIEVPGPEEFTVDGGDDVTIEVGDSIQLFGNYDNAQGLAELIWLAPYEGTLSCDTCYNPWSHAQNTITYELFGKDDKGCEAFDEILVEVQKTRGIYVPTAFSPKGNAKGDDINDILLVHGRPGTRVKSFRVYDRWGELIYEDGNFEVSSEAGGTRGWNGTFGSSNVPSGVYIWVVEAVYIDDVTEVFKGQTTVIR